MSLSIIRMRSNNMTKWIYLLKVFVQPAYEDIIIGKNTRQRGYWSSAEKRITGRADNSEEQASS
jgi:hypothetical protein